MGYWVPVITLAIAILLLTATFGTRSARWDATADKQPKLEELIRSHIEDCTKRREQAVRVEERVNSIGDKQASIEHKVDSIDNKLDRLLER